MAPALSGLDGGPGAGSGWRRIFLELAAPPLGLGWIRHRAAQTGPFMGANGSRRWAPQWRSEREWDSGPKGANSPVFLWLHTTRDALGASSPGAGRPWHLPYPRDRFDGQPFMGVVNCFVPDPGNKGIQTKWFRGGAAGRHVSDPSVGTCWVADSLEDNSSPKGRRGWGLTPPRPQQMMGAFSSGRAARTCDGCGSEAMETPGGGGSQAWLTGRSGFWTISG